MRQFLLILVAASTLVSQQQPRKVFVVDKVTQTAKTQDYGNATKVQEGEHHSAPVVMAEFMKRCPAISFTEKADSAEFILKTQPGGSMLTNGNGEVLYLSPAVTLKNMVKDVCAYITSH